jgi:hypothetical protein
MNELLNAIGHNLAQNIGYEEGAFGLLLAVFVHNMPATIPKTFQEIWTWVRDSLQTALPVRRP